MQSEQIDTIETNAPVADVFVLDDIERRVIRQFVEALLFEALVSFVTTDREPSSFTQGQEESVFDKQFEFCCGQTRFKAVGTIRAFDRVRLLDGSVQRYISESDLWREASLHEIVETLDIEDRAKTVLLQELDQTIALCRWNKSNLNHHKVDRRALDFQSLESAVTEGHLYHPCFKTRTGFSERDHELYGPESGQQFQLLWLAVKRSDIDVNLPKMEDDFWQEELGCDEYQRLGDLLSAMGCSWRDYGLMPVHPWQYAYLSQCGLKDLMERYDIILLGRAGDLYQASQSLRTLVNVSNPSKANVKVPLNVICTSSLRNLRPHFVHTAPTISEWLQGLLVDDEFLKERNNTILLSEYAGLLYQSSEHGMLDGKLGVIFRESVVAKLNEGEAALPFSALMLVESDGLPFIHHWLIKYGVEAWLNQLLDVMFVPIWHMLVHHGVAFEAHSQNLILIHRNGWPEKIVLRDFHDGTEYVPEFLQNPAKLPKLEEVDEFFRDIPIDDGFAMASVEALRELFMDTVYVFNLADLAFLLERFYALSDDVFWSSVQSHLLNYEKSGITDKKRIEKVCANTSEIAVESLIKKKILHGGYLDIYEHSVRNRLADV